MQNIIAIICDCDDTLAPDTTSALLESNGIDIESFWNKKIAKQVQQGWDPPLAWMTAIVDMMNSGEIKQNTNQKLFDFGKKVKPYKGVTKFISELKKSVNKNSDFVDAGIKLESYIISSGIEDIIKGSPLNKHFDDIYAAKLLEDQKTKKITGIKSSVTFTEKTKFLYAINKGIPVEMMRKNPYSVNDSIAPENRRIPFEYMIYLGDGPTDIPCFSAVKGNHGNAIGIFGDGSVHKAYELARGKRTTVGPYSRKYTTKTDLYQLLDAIIKRLGYEIVNKKRRKETII